MQALVNIPVNLPSRPVFNRSHIWVRSAEIVDAAACMCRTILAGGSEYLEPVHVSGDDEHLWIGLEPQSGE